ncbi:MAG: alpha/beta fold hydrolase [Parvularculaceae bacterium]
MTYREYHVARGRLAVISAAMAGVIALAVSASGAAARHKPITEMACPDLGVRGDIRCVAVGVPENPARPRGRHIEIFAFIVKSTSDTPADDPIFYFVGGPGGSASTRPQLIRGVGPLFARDRDVVFLDQRGAGRSGHMSCDPSRNTALAEELEGGEPLDDEIVAACWRVLSRDHDLSTYNTTNSVHDFEALRKALGYGPVNIIGASYGTRLGIEYARLYPESVRTAALFGVTPPSIDLFTGRANALQAAIEAMVRDCEADAECAAAYPGLRADVALVSELLHDGEDMTAEIQTSDGPRRVAVDDRSVIAWIERNFKVVETIAAMPRAFSRLARGDNAFLVEFLSRNPPGAAGALGPFSEGLYYSVACAEDAPFLDLEIEWRASKGTLLRTNMVESVLEACRRWPVPPAPPAFKAQAATSASMLLISGDYDATTPYWAAEMAAAYGPNSRALRLKNRSHRLTYRPQDCLVPVFMAYFREANAWTVDARCAETLTRPPWELPDTE